MLTVPFSSSIVAFQAVAYEYAVEMTYPLPEGTSANIVNVVSQVGRHTVDQVCASSNKEIAGGSKDTGFALCVAVGQTLAWV